MCYFFTEIGHKSSKIQLFMQEIVIIYSTKIDEWAKTSDETNQFRKHKSIRNTEALFLGHKNIRDINLFLCLKS